MKATPTFRLLFVIICFLQFSDMYASTNEVFNVTAGNLGTLLGSKKDTMTTMVLSGQINGTDIDVLRQMTHLSALNLANVTIVTGGYFTAENTVITVKNNQLPNGMFSKITSLKSVIIPNSVTDIGDHAFYGCTGLTSVKIPDKVVHIGSLAFHDCTGVTTIEIGSSVDSIGPAAFCGGLKLKSFIVSKSNTKFSTLDGVLIKMNRLIRFPNKKSTSYSIPYSVTSIAEHAFCGCTDLLSVNIPANVLFIGEDAFLGCTRLTEIHCRASLPPAVFSGSFYNIDKNLCKLYVPMGASTTYRNITDWNSFINIIEEQPTDISERPLAVVNVYSNQNDIVVSNAPIGETIFVYNLLGDIIRKMKVTDEVLRINVPANQLYLVKIATKIVKVAL